MILCHDGGTSGTLVDRCRVACRVASRLWRQNARSDAVNAPRVETKVLHYSVPAILGRGRAGGLLGRGLSAVSDGRWQCPTAICLRRMGVYSVHIPQRPSRRVACDASPNTFPHSISGNEKKKNEVSA